MLEVIPLLDSWNPDFLAILSALFIAVARVFYTSGLAKVTPALSNFILALISTAIALLVYQSEGGLEKWPLEGLLWFISVGVFGTFFGRFMLMVSIKLLGMARSAVMAQTVLIWSAVPAVVFLGERMTFSIAAGTIGIMCGSILLVLDKGEAKKNFPLRYYLVPLVMTLSFSFAHMSVKRGLLIIPSPAFGMLSASMTAIFFTTGLLFLTDGVKWKTLEKRPLLAICFGSVLNGFASITLWGAMKYGDIVRVVPLNRLSVLLVIFFSWLFFRKQELINRRIVFGGILAVAGAFGIISGR